MVKRMERELITMHQEINILDNGSKTRKMEMEFYNIRTELYMTVNGLMISLRIRDRSSMQIRINIKELF